MKAAYLMDSRGLKVAEIEIYWKTKVKNSERQKVCRSSEVEKIFRGIEDFNKNISMFECFYAMYLNQADKILAVFKISEGGSVGTTCDVIKILSPALLLQATGVILCHNHPSGNLYPSREDKKTTTTIKKACEIMGIKLLDHLIISDEGYYSFNDTNNI